MPRIAKLGHAVQARSTGGVVTSSLPPGQLRLIGAGRPLDPGIRASMETFFGSDFSAVRVHEGPVAQQLGALAFTLGDTLYFAPGLYNPTSREGIELLGHELTHVVQQRSGRVPSPDRTGIAIVQDPALEAEADAMGRQAAEQMSSRPGVARHTPRSRPHSGAFAPMSIAARGAILRMEAQYVDLLSDEDFWSFRGSNDLLYIVKNHELFITHAGAALAELLSSVNFLVWNPPRTKIVFRADRMDWSKLLSIEIQAKKTLQDREKYKDNPRQLDNIRLHVKFYFEHNYALRNFPGANAEYIEHNFKEVASYYDPGKVGSYQQVFGEDPTINTLVVPDIRAFLDSHTIYWSLAITKNTYIFSDFYVHLIKEYNRRK